MNVAEGGSSSAKIEMICSRSSGGRSRREDIFCERSRSVIGLFRSHTTQSQMTVDSWPTTIQISDVVGGRTPRIVVLVLFLKEAARYSEERMKS